ncbi:tetraspanin-2A-like [Prorops nasuta]|uniref:tetraspanin-2A-like n=1 Tax=Prorops nasuta TaxID=863751 RepID=UPI0034CE0A97
MVVKGSVHSQLERHIDIIKFLIFCFNAILWLLGSAMFGLSMWMRFEPEFQEWVEFLNMYEFYIGIYILITASIFVIILSFVGCGVALMENKLGLLIQAGVQLFCFILGLAGACVILDYSTYDSQIQPIIRRSMNNLISNSQHERASFILRILQENIGCCGADGPMDYLTMLKPLPNECRDSVTGNAFFHGCVEEISWFLEARSGWIAGLALSLCMLHVTLAVFSLILVKAIRKQEDTVIYKS